jgi:2-keto-4-pentenoate hydratase/2-oxohepta-3-ene-1,7-dioic acid hydratase in catechol pathway
VKLANVNFDNRDLLAVALDDHRLLDLTSAGLPAGMRALIEMGPAGMAAVQHILDNPNSTRSLDADLVTWHPPVREPGKVICIAMNNSTSNARKISAPDHPLYFNKASSSLIGHKQPIIVYDYYGSVHPEPELAVIVGKIGRNFSVEEADDYVYGYTNLNDITGNGMRNEDRVHYMALYASEANPDVLEKREQHLSYAGRYKGADTFGPMGPYLVTKDELPGVNNLDVQCKWGDEIIAQDSTAYFNYPVAEALAFLSRYHTLKPGDIISMGTAFKPSPGSKRSLHTANLNLEPRTVTMSISGLGTLINPVERITTQ